MTEVVGGGRYRIVRRLAAGGMGEVLLAETDGTESLSAGQLVMKRVLPGRPGEPASESAVNMLREEARLGLRLRHHNLVHTFGLEELDGQTLLAMEFLAGRSMAQVLGQTKKRGALLPVDAVLQIVRASACGLHFAHTLKGRDGRSLGLVHRDVSPANIFVTFDGEVKVIDFGVAKSADSEIHTAQNVLKGKLGYMSPEQATSMVDRLTAQADVFSLGVFFWESLIAERLFYSPNAAATLMQISTKPVPVPSSLRPDVNEDVDALCMLMLERNLAKRPDNCAAVVRAIDTMLASMPRSSIKNQMATMFASELEASANELKPAAVLLSDRGAPRGLAEGTASAVTEEEEAATAVLSPGVREQMLAELARRDAPIKTAEDNSPEQEAATIRVSGDELAVLRAALPRRPTPPRAMLTVPMMTMPVLQAPVQAPVRAPVQAPVQPNTQDDARTIALLPAAGMMPARTPPPRFVEPPAVTRTTAPSVVPVVSGLAIAATIIGLVALVLGTLLATVARPLSPRPLVTAKTAAGPAIGTLVSDFTGAVQLNEADPRLADGTRITAEELQRRLESTGLSVRRTLPITTKGWVALALPPLLLGLGLATLGLGAPMLRSRFRGRGLLQVTAVLTGLAMVGYWMWFGGLSWPGWSALQVPQTTLW